MAESRSRFSIQVDETTGTCPVGEKWAKQNIAEKVTPVLSCEGPCIRGDIARLAANIVAREDGYARSCYAEVALVPHSSMAQWVKQAEKIIMIDGCFLACIGRVLNNLVDEDKIIHIDALRLHKKYSDIFHMDDVPEAERKATAQEVADKILAQLRVITLPPSMPKKSAVVSTNE
ncbi:MAG TPA: putative zinc-binding protein [Bacteroidota bacterium]|nr:putative zinc-binding protein [Bacteroidota bacterium]